MSRFVITGCAGFIGSHLADRLLAEGHEVVGIDSFDDFYPRALKEDNLAVARTHASFSFREADLVDRADSARGETGVGLAELVEGSDAVFHLAAQAGVRGSWGRSFESYLRQNELATQRLLEASVSSAVPKLVYTSSSSVYGEQERLPLKEDMVPRPRSPYGVTKLAAEHLCGLYHENHGLETVALRLFSVYGPRQRPDMAFHRFIRALTDGDAIAVYGNGRQTRDFTYVGDIVDGLLRAWTAPGGTVMNIGGGHRVGLADAVDTLATIMEVEPRIDHRAAAAGDVRDTLADVGRAQELVGYRPGVSLAEGLEAELEWFRARRAEGLV